MNVRICLTLAVTIFASAALAASPKKLVFLGPPESGTFSGSEKWVLGARGAASTRYDFNDPSQGACAFVISNTAAGKENISDLRCPLFPLEAPAGEARPVNFTLSYKISDHVAPGDDVHLQLRFFDSATNQVGERNLLLGTHTGDSVMQSYRTLTLNNVQPPKSARLVDIFIIANSDVPWTSGNVRFDDFSVTTEPAPLIPSIGVWTIGVSVLLIVGGVSAALVIRSRRSVGLSVP